MTIHYSFNLGRLKWASQELLPVILTAGVKIPEDSEHFDQIKHLLDIPKEPIQTPGTMNDSKMRQLAEELIEATERHTLRPRNGDRANVLAEALGFVIEQLSYTQTLFDGSTVIATEDVEELIRHLNDLGERND